MRLPIGLLVLIVVTLPVHSAMAQSAYSYPWCATYGRAPSTSCYFASWEQCMATISGIGGICYTNPYFQPPAAAGARPRHAAENRHRGRQS